MNEFANHFDVSFDYLANFTNNRQYNKVIKDLDPKLIGERLTKIRKENNISQRALADLLNTSSSTISAYETGKVLILTSFAYEIAKRYSVSLDWLCGKTK